MLSSHPLDQARHTPDQFASGEEDLDAWLIQHAQDSEDRGVTRTFVWTDVDTTRVIAYYTLMAHVIRREDLPKSIGRGSPHEIPAILLARLAVDKRAHGKGHGSALLGDALERALLAAAQVGARFVVVDALHEKAAGFYTHHGFTRIPDTMRLIQKMSSIAKALEAIAEPE
jgi:GNAT superfamily N-acetyltransferase